MRLLPATLHKNSSDYVLITREGRLCLYEQQYGENLKYFEVFEVKVKPQTVFNGMLFPAREVFPSDSDFGKTAWTFHSLRDAVKKFNELRGTQKVIGPSLPLLKTTIKKRSGVRNT